ncbi:pseudouridine synthesis protein [Malassezia pachydermatis]|uniref:H/ACA ribonucleoprotein complex non-core subunit NAF1 n=1 Tax=Malassezia pachydermatis TaxID=77020 RepID=A0A0M8MX73_9BASI|nr:snornp assembly factor [Malassezia pachydermatis]KOS15630.1 snornp assembly factor [Malassezia pachydermatis]
MGVEQSKLRPPSNDTSNQPSTHDTEDITTPSTVTTVAKTDDTPLEEADHTLALLASSDANAAQNRPDPPETTSTERSLSEQRELVQKLRASQGNQLASDADIQADMLLAGVTDTRNEAAEDTEASTSEDDSDSSSDSDSSEEETAPVPIQELDEDEGGGDQSAPRTKHEVVDESVPLPPFKKVPAEELDSLQPIGRIHSIVDNVVLVAQVDTSNSVPSARSYDVLDSESLLCFEDGEVLGLIYETFGSVQAPMYTVRFRAAVDIDHDMVHIGKTVYFLPSSSTYVLTRQIRTKGSDASNMWDEEVAEDEVEYSDDEAEAAAKRKSKKARTSSHASESATVDPATASLGPLGGKRSSGPTNRGGRRRDAQASSRYPFPPGWGDSQSRRMPSDGGLPQTMPHINPRFAPSWFGAPTMPYAMPPFPMPVPGYSPNYPTIGMPTSHEPYQPNVRPSEPSSSYRSDDAYDPSRPQ